MKVAKSAQRWGSSVTVTLGGMERTNSQTRISCEKVLGGISWPAAGLPGYFCIFGQTAELRGEKNALVLLSEFEANMPSELINQVLQASQRYNLHGVFRLDDRFKPGFLEGIQEIIHQLHGQEGLHRQIHLKEKCHLAKRGVPDRGVGQGRSFKGHTENQHPRPPAGRHGPREPA